MNAVGLLGDLVHRQQGEGVHLNVLLLDLVAEGGGQLLLAVALQHVELGQVLSDHVVDGGGDGALAVKGGVVGVGVHVRLLDVDVVVADEAAAVAALHHQAVVLHRLVGVLLGKGGVHVRVLLDHRDVVGQALVLVEQVLDDVVLLAGLDDPVDGHVLFQGVDHHLGVAGDGVELGGADIVFGQGGGQGGHQHIHRDENGQHHRRDNQGVGAALKGDAVSRRLLPVPMELPALHQLYLRFSRDWTERKRKNPITDR